MLVYDEITAYLSGQQEVSGNETIAQMLINNDFNAIVNENYED